MIGRFFQEVAKKFLKFPDVETILPTRADDGSAGYDFYTKCDIHLEPGESYMMPTDVKAYMGKNEVLFCFIRSSIGFKLHVGLKNDVGVIDSSFYCNPDNDGNIHLPLHNYSDVPVFIAKGDRVMQGVFLPFLLTNDDAPLNGSRTGGFGSSGK